jgi:hypothetical protein
MGSSLKMKVEPTTDGIRQMLTEIAARIETKVEALGGTKTTSYRQGVRYAIDYLRWVALRVEAEGAPSAKRIRDNAQPVVGLDDIKSILAEAGACISALADKPTSTSADEVCSRIATIIRDRGWTRDGQRVAVLEDIEGVLAEAGYNTDSPAQVDQR